MGIKALLKKDKRGGAPEQVRDSGAVKWGAIHAEASFFSRVNQDFGRGMPIGFTPFGYAPRPVTLQA